MSKSYPPNDNWQCLQNILDSERCKQDDWNDLQYAVYFNFDEIVQKELSKGANVDQVFVRGNTALHVACDSNCNLNIVKILLSYRPNMNIRNEALETPLNIFIRNGYLDVGLLKTMLELGADPNIPDKAGYSPVHYLHRYSSRHPDQFSSYVELLTEYKANWNVQNNDGETALHLAIRIGFELFVKLLLEKNALLSIKDRSGYTPLHMAFYINSVAPRIFNTVVKESIMLGNFRTIIDVSFYESIDTAGLLKPLKIFEDQCNEGLLIFKCVKIAETNVSLYDVLTSSPSRLAIYLRNEDILKALKNFSTVDCGIFRRRFVQRFEHGMERMEATEIAYPYVIKTFKGLPAMCLDKIISFLSNEDLYNLKYAHVKRLSLSN